MLSSLSPALAFLAGLLTILSPCVLPLVPVVFATAHNRHRWGPLALGSGLALSFVAVGIFLATAGFALGLDPDILRNAGAVLLVAFGVILLVPAAQHWLSAAATPMGSIAERLMPAGRNALGQQFSIGAVLGIVWLPCVGPTLGAALVLASQGQNLGQVSMVMLAFGIGAALPLILIGTLSAKAFATRRGTVGQFGRAGRSVLGAILTVVGLAILTGLDRQFEAMATAALPDWWIALTTRY